MFLAQLSDKSKDLFLRLCISAAQANDIVEEKEKNLIDDYCREMEVAKPETFDAASFDELADEAKALPAAEKKIILLELLGLVKVDGEYDEAEKEFMRKLAAACALPEKLLTEFDGLLDQYLAICSELSQAIWE